jgi:hypothetical protein
MTQFVTLPTALPAIILSLTCKHSQRQEEGMTPTKIGERSLPIVASLCMLCTIAIPVANAASFTVTVFTDTNSGGLAGLGAGAAGDLRSQILAANAAGGADTITFNCGSPPCTITLTGPLPPITDSLTINGGSTGNIVISGANAYRVFFVDTGTVTLQNLVVQDGLAQGGAGGSGDGGGGGGAGLGGGLFVNQAGAAVTLNNVQFVNCGAVGGVGGNYVSQSYAGGGGGGLAFRGGNSGGNTGGPGGGGVLGPGTDVSSLSNGTAGGAGGGGGGGYHSSGTAGAGGAGYATNGGGSAGNLTTGGAGGFGGGGGAAAVGIGGNGGFGGGGGGTGNPTVPGNGGPGGGGGGSDGASGGTGGSLITGLKGGNGGNGTGGGGGGGAAVGPAVFVNAGSLTIVNSTATGSTATGGAAGTGLSGHNGTAGNANSTSLFVYAGVANSASITGPSTLLDPQTNPTPAPASALLLLLGFAIIGIYRWRRGPGAA